jgi:hypothetical protein
VAWERAREVFGATAKADAIGLGMPSLELVGESPFRRWARSDVTFIGGAAVRVVEWNGTGPRFRSRDVEEPAQRFRAERLPVLVVVEVSVRYTWSRSPRGFVEAERRQRPSIRR